MKSLRRALTLGVIALALVGCGNTLNCQILGDNAKGRVTFANGSRVQAGVPVVVEWSEDSFSTVAGTSSRTNMHGVLAIPYSLCVDSGVPIQFRAYQDLNADATWDAGEANGRYDGTSTGDAAYTSKTVPATTSNSESSDWPVLTGIDIALDVP